MSKEQKIVKVLSRHYSKGMVRDLAYWYEMTPEEVDTVYADYVRKLF